MTKVADFKPQPLRKFNRFREFIFVSDSAMNQTPELSSQLQLASSNSFLDRATIGDIITIQQIHAPRNVTRQLRHLKFQPEQKVQLVSRTNNGSVVVNLNNTLIGIGKAIAQRVVVSVVGKVKQ
jgi:Fe2+ transport system protein FeoA